MDYEESKHWLFSLHVEMKDYDLKKMRLLIKLAKLDLQSLKTVHVAGSNGKGSTCAYISSTLTEQGYKTGFYSSPHILEPTERMRINGKKIPKEKFAQLADYFRKLMENSSVEANFFEVVTAMAFKYFIEEKVDILVAETGMGGRLDATNILDGKVCAITSISLEHTQFLGNTIKKIAAEKAGIIKENSAVVFAHNNKGKKIIIEKAKEKNAMIFEVKWKNKRSQKFGLVKPEKIPRLRTKMLGTYQIENAAVAAAAMVALREKGFAVSDKSIRTGIAKTIWRGRLETLQKKPLVIVDAAHNPQGWHELFKEVRKMKFLKMHVVFGAMADKELDKELKQNLRKAHTLILTKSDSPRAFEPEELRKKIGAGKIEMDAKEAIVGAINSARKDDLVLITGSIHVIGYAYKVFSIRG
ncbi:MAG: folylpolyglutamate synthase/dihydrofolate synthase family protein [archaeon]